MRVLATACLLAIFLATTPPVRAQNGAPAFTRVNQPGFGDYQNSYAWSMKWFNGKLYVGTARNIQCVELATVQFFFPNSHNYPPKPGGCPVCTPSQYDLNLQGEIWSYTPETHQWARVFQSPNDLANPLAPGKSVARDIGFRDMIVFTEANGTQALYVAGVSAREYIPGLPLPRLLRSTDGVNFTPVTLTIPNVPNTVMGLRAMASYNGSLFMTATTELTGQGIVVQSSNPASGNFRIVTPPAFKAYELEVFNNFLYIGAADLVQGYSVWKTKATGTPPFALTPVVTNGAGRGKTMASVVAMHAFKGQLYAGSAGWDTPLAPCELIRINPNDTWDLVVGNPRVDPATHRMKLPVSGLPDGFGNPFNAHIWRLDDYNGTLYAGTNDASLAYAKLVPFFPGIATRYGFDLYSSKDGVYWSVVTTTGFGSPTSFGARTMASTPAGFFIGSANSCIGAEVFLTTAAAPGHASRALPPSPSALDRGRSTNSRRIEFASLDAMEGGSNVPAPSRLQGESVEGVTLLSWDPQPGAVSYEVTREAFVPAPRLASSTGASAAPLFIPGPTRQIGSSPKPYFRDPSGADDTRYLYHVRAVDEAGRRSAPSNIAVVSGASESATTFGALLDAVDDLSDRGRSPSASLAPLKEFATRSRSAAAAGDFGGARRELQFFQDHLTRMKGGALDPREAEDLAVRASTLMRRVHLVQEGVLSRHALDPP
jgi:hypothetical protein